MTYELAKELKDAGFPQGMSTWVWIKPLIHPEYVLSLDVREDKNKVPDDTWKDIYAAPTLSELIEACGDDFRDLVYHSKRTPESTYQKYTVKGGMRKLGDWSLRSGHTPEEAVAKLWLALHSKA